MESTRRLRRIAAAGGVALALVALGGCLGEDSSSSGASSSSGTTSSSSSSSSTGSSSSSSSSTAASLAISGTPTTAVAVGSVYSFQPTTTASGSVGYSIQNMPSWASFSTSTGQLLGTPTSANVGAYPSIVISASNGSTSASLPAFTVTVDQPSASATSNSPGSVTLTWSPPTANTDGSPFNDLAGFYVYYGTSSSAMSTVVDDETGGTDTGSFTVSGLAPGTYYFQVSAYSALGVQSSPSNEVSVTVS